MKENIVTTLKRRLPSGDQFRHITFSLWAGGAFMLIWSGKSQREVLDAFAVIVGGLGLVHILASLFSSERLGALALAIIIALGSGFVGMLFGISQAAIVGGALSFIATLALGYFMLGTTPKQ